VAETNGLLNRRTGFTRTEGSNPSRSATFGLQISQIKAPSRNLERKKGRCVLTVFVEKILSCQRASLRYT
jgi:hypothetical protein